MLSAKRQSGKILPLLTREMEGANKILRKRKIIDFEVRFETEILLNKRGGGFQKNLL